MKIDSEAAGGFDLTSDDLETGECYERRDEDGFTVFIIVTDEESYVYLGSGSVYPVEGDEDTVRYRHLPNATFRPEG